MSIDLRSIFATVVNDPAFLQVTEQMVVSDPLCPLDEPRDAAAVDDSSRMYTLLPAGSLVSAEHSLIPMARAVIPSSHFRRGVQADVAGLPSASLLATVALLMRPELRELNQAELIPELRLFNEFLRTSITNNAQIDTIKNTAAIQKQNAMLINHLSMSSITGDLIQRIANIMEVNILASHLDTRICMFYWARGKAHSHLNVYRDLWCITCLDNRCEPILCECDDPKECMLSCYSRILEHPTIKHWFPITLGFPELCRMLSNGPQGLKGSACIKYYDAPKPIPTQTLLRVCRALKADKPVTSPTR